MVNYLALLGWSPGDDETVVSARPTWSTRFDLDDGPKNAAIFDTDEAGVDERGVHLRQMSAEAFAAGRSPNWSGPTLDGRPHRTPRRQSLVDLAAVERDEPSCLTEVAPRTGGSSSSTIVSTTQLHGRR